MPAISGCVLMREILASAATLLQLLYANGLAAAESWSMLLQEPAHARLARYGEVIWEVFLDYMSAACRWSGRSRISADRPCQ